MKKGFSVIIFLLVASVGFSQNIEIYWIELSGNKIIVHYNLEDNNPNHQYLVSLFSSNDSFTTPLTQVAGDVGPGVRPGFDKKITWDITKELQGFKGDLSFEVRGRVFIPYVKLLNFNQGMEYKKGSNVILNWESGNLSGQVNIELFKGEERIPVENNAPNNGRYNWRVPNDLKKGNDYLLRFTNSDELSDYVESPAFRIKPKVPFVAKLAGGILVGGGLWFLINSDGGTPQEEALPGHPGLPN